MKRSYWHRILLLTFIPYQVIAAEQSQQNITISAQTDNRSWVYHLFFPPDLCLNIFDAQSNSLIGTISCKKVGWRNYRLSQLRVGNLPKKASYKYQRRILYKALEYCFEKGARTVIYRSCPEDAQDSLFPLLLLKKVEMSLERIEMSYRMSQHPSKKEEYITFLRTDQPMLGAIEVRYKFGSKTVGFALCDWLKCHDNKNMFLSFHVLPERRRCGYGAQIFKAAHQLLSRMTHEEHVHFKSYPIKQGLYEYCPIEATPKQRAALDAWYNKQPGVKKIEIDKKDYDYLLNVPKNRSTDLSRYRENYTEPIDWNFRSTKIDYSKIGVQLAATGLIGYACYSALITCIKEGFCQKLLAVTADNFTQ